MENSPYRKRLIRECVDCLTVDLKGLIEITDLPMKEVLDFLDKLVFGVNTKKRILMPCPLLALAQHYPDQRFFDILDEAARKQDDCGIGWTSSWDFSFQPKAKRGAWIWIKLDIEEKSDVLDKAIERLRK